MNRNTIVEIAIPKALYESIKGKLLKEASISSNPDIKQLEMDLFDALNSPEVERLIKQGIAKMKPEDKTSLAQSAISEAEGGDFSSFQKMVSKFVDKTPVSEASYSFSDLESSDDKAKSEISRAAGTVIKNAGKANLMSMGFLPAILAIVTDYIGGTHIVDSVASAVGDGSVAAILSVAGGLIGGGILWKIGSMLKGEKMSGDETLFEKKKAPSAGLTKAEKSTIAKKAAAGKDIGKKGKGFEKVAAKAAKEYGSKEAGKKVAAAAMWKSQAGKKKMNEYDEDDVPTPDGEYRNPNNRITDDGTYSVISYNSSRGKRLFTGTYQECKEFIEEKLYGDFDDYGIFKN